MYEDVPRKNGGECFRLGKEDMVRVIPEDVKMTPMLEQYCYWKERYPECLLFFRMGDFFEMFFDDAETASRILDITLTARDPEKKIPMAGVPFHAAENYLSRLVEAGYRVAICDQVEEPEGKKLVDRQVIRVVTPGTYASSDGRSDGRLGALAPRGNLMAFALLVPCTGDFEAGVLPHREALGLLRSFEPGDVLCPASEEEALGASLDPQLAKRLIPRDKGEFDPRRGEVYLAKSFGVASLEGFGFSRGDLSLGCAAGALRYLEETQFSLPPHIRGIRPYQPKTFLYLDGTTRKNLELFHGEGETLFSVLNRCKNPMGRRTLREWILRPLRDDERILERQDRVAFVVNNPAFSQKAGALFAECQDVERALGRLSLGVGTPRDLGALRHTLNVLPSLIKLGENTPFEGFFPGSPELLELGELLSRGLERDLPVSWKTGEVIRTGFDEELDRCRRAQHKGEVWLQEYLTRERERTGIRTLKIGSNKVFGYYLEMSRSGSVSVPPEYVRRQTLVSAERYITEELKEFEETLLLSESQGEQRERTLYRELCCRAMERAEDLQRMARGIAEADVLRSLGEVAWERKYVRPLLSSEEILEVIQGRHPVVEVSLESRPFVPNDLVLSREGRRIAIVTGPNMAGKSTYLRMGALLILMAHMGSFVPAASARIPLTDRIFTRIGARDELDRGNSTFMVEMLETANILHNLTSRSFVVLDEIGRGTSTYDGMSIAWAILEYLARSEHPARVLFATHYHELTRLGEEYPEIRNLSMAAEEVQGGITFLHRVVPYPANRSYGIEVARLAGIPEAVLRRSQELLERFERDQPPEGLPGDPLSKREEPAQKKLFPHAEGQAILDELALLNPDGMTPLKALEMLYILKKRSLQVLKEQKNDI